MKILTVQELKQWIDDKKDFQLIDVREHNEVEVSHLGGLHIPLGTLAGEYDAIATDKPVVFHCRSGKRSEMAARIIERDLGLTDVYNLEGGIMAWAREIDPDMLVG